MSHETKALVRKLTTLRDLLRKNCGTGPGGFQPGNTCGRRGAGANNPEGAERRRRRGKRRKRRGPDRGLGDRTRAAQRRRSGRQNASRRKWRESLMKPDGSPEGRTLYRQQVGERKDLADSLKADRKEQRKDAAKEIKGTAREIKSERKALAKDQKQDRVKLKRTQEREAERTHAGFDKQQAKLDAKYEAQKATAKNPEAIDRAYAKRKQELDAERAETIADLNDGHRQERTDLRTLQKIDREQARDEHRDRAEDVRREQRLAVTDINTSAREQIGELQFGHRVERAELIREEQGFSDASDDKSYSWVDAKATPDDSVPGAQAILDGVLAKMGHAEAWADGSLDVESRRKLLHQVRLDARAWFRGEAQEILDGLSEKALFGQAKEKAARFFGRASRFIREMAVAGVLALAGPGVIDRNEGMARELDDQIKIQRQYLEKFEQQIIVGDYQVDGTFVARAEQYGSAAWSAAQNTVRAGTTATGRMKFEHRVHRGKRIPGDPCDECRDLEDMGWQPINTLPPIGVTTPCGDKCHCDFEYREEIGGPTYFEDLGVYYLLPGPQDDPED